MENIRVRLQVYAGGPTPLSFEDFLAKLPGLNAKLAPAGITLTADKKRYEQFPNSLIAMDDDKKEQDPTKREANLMARLDYARQHMGSLCFFLATGAPAGYGRGEFGVLLRLVGSPGEGTYLHELGHTLNLFHNFAEDWCDGLPSEAAPKTLSAEAEAMFPGLLAKAGNNLDTALTALRRNLERKLDGDSPENGGIYAVSDTPFSIHEINLPENRKNMNGPNYALTVPFKAVIPGTGATTQSISLSPDFGNYMGYSDDTFTKSFSPQQIDRMRSTLTRGSLLRANNGFLGNIDPFIPAVTATTVSFPTGMFDLNGGLFGSLGGAKNTLTTTGISVFDVGPEGRVSMRTKTKGSTLWSAPFDLGGNAVGRAAACTLDGGNTFVVFRDGQNNLWAKAGAQDSWGANFDRYEWTALGGKSLMQLVCTTDRAGGVLVFGVGTDNKLYVNACKDGKGQQWSGWIGLGGDLAMTPAVLATGPNQVEVAATFNDGAVWIKTFSNGTWTPGQLSWTSLGGKTAHRPALAGWAPGRVDVFATGTDDVLYSKLRENGKWWPGATDWNRIEPTLINTFSNGKPTGQVIRGDKVWTTPFVYTPKVGELQIWAVDMRSQNLIRNVWTQAKNGYGGWELFGGHLAGPLNGIVNADGELEIVGRFCDGTTWSRTPSRDWSRVDVLQQT